LSEVGKDAIKAVVFDVFGTVVDWRGSIVAVGAAITARGGPDIDWGQFADTWRRDGYIAPITAFARGQQTEHDVDVLLRGELDLLAAKYEVAPADQDELMATWRRLVPWSDSVGGLTRLRTRYVIGPLSNGGFGQLTEMAKFGGLPWDCIISTELFESFKPDPAVYLGAARLLGREPGEVMLAAAHVGDLRAAAAVGLATAYIPRPLEWGLDGPPVDPPDADFDIVATDFGDLADQLL
jgi:2-haloacid dehalogenase